MAPVRADLPERLRVRGRERVRLSEAAAGRTLGWDEPRARAVTAKLAVELEELQFRLYADGRYGMLVENDICVVKIFLHISKAEQRRRFEERIHERRKQWKFDVQDLVKRGQWQAYRQAFGDMLGRCNSRHAPWYVVPADHKWLRDLAVSQIMLEALKALPLRFPPPKFDPQKIRVR